MESNDRLNWGDESEIEKIIPLDRGINNFSLTYNLEPLLFSDVVQKINRWNLKNERILVLTTKYIYLFRKKRN